MRQLALSREDQINVRQRQHRYGYRLGDDITVQIHRWHRVARQVLGQRRRVNDLHPQRRQVRQNAVQERNDLADRELQGDGAQGQRLNGGRWGERCRLLLRALPESGGPDSSVPSMVTALSRTPTPLFFFSTQ